MAIKTRAQLYLLFEDGDEPDENAFKDLMDSVYFKSEQEFGASAFFQGGGNSFSETAILGTTDEYGLGIVTNSQRRVTVTPSGRILIGTEIESTYNLDLSGMLRVSGANANGYVAYIGNATDGGSNSHTLRVAAQSGGSTARVIQAWNTKGAGSELWAVSGTGVVSQYNSIVFQPTATGRSITGLDQISFYNDNDGYIKAPVDGAMSFGTNNTTRLYLHPSGVVETYGAFKTAQPTASGSGAWKLGKKIAASVALVTTDYIEVEIDGVIYKLALVA